MTEPAPAPAAARLEYSKDYWDIVVSQLARRPSVRLSLAILALLYAVAIYAPLIAGDRPLVLTASDAASYKSNLKLLSLIVANYKGLVSGGPEEYAKGKSTRTWAEALDGERDALVAKVDLLRDHLAGPDRAIFDELLGDLATAHDRAAAGDTAAAGAAADAALALAKRAKAELVPAEAGAAPEPGKSVALVSQTTWPAFAAISRSE